MGRDFVLTKNKKAWKVIRISMALVLVALLAGKWRADQTYFSDYEKALPLNPQVERPLVNVAAERDFFGVPREKSFARTQISFESRVGERVPTVLTFPPDPKGAYPVVILLHGIGQSKKFLEDICTPFNKAGFAMVCFDQSMRGDRKVEDNPWWRDVVDFRQRPWKTVNDTRRLIDYLETRADIDASRIYMVGASFGAITGTSAVALEKRIRAAVLVVGGAHLPTMLDAPVIKGEVNPLLHALAKPLACYVMAPSDPLHLAPRTAPTPLLLLNGDVDTFVTPDAGRALFDAVGEPKEIRWYPTDHPGLRDGDGPVVVDMLDDALAWLLERDANPGSAERQLGSK
jgi:dienelactone hydrolase